MVTQDRLAELKRLAKRLPELKVAVLLSDDTPEYREAVQLHGGHYSVAKDGLEDQLPPVLNSVRQVVASRAG
jgi:DNA-binding NarL/FixJ family response regulator